MRNPAQPFRLHLLEPLRRRYTPVYFVRQSTPMPNATYMLHSALKHEAHKSPIRVPLMSILRAMTQARTGLMWQKKFSRMRKDRNQGTRTCTSCGYCDGKVTVTGKTMKDAALINRVPKCRGGFGAVWLFFSSVADQAALLRVTLSLSSKPSAAAARAADRSRWK